jgi:hypothetical protein
MGQYHAVTGDSGESPRASSAAGRPSEQVVARRSYIDADGLAWEVREVVGTDVPGARGPSCLVFESAVVIRRVWTFPDDWRQMSTEDLARLSWER